jgi:hypothetical protein
LSDLNAGSGKVIRILVGRRGGSSRERGSVIVGDLGELGWLVVAFGGEEGDRYGQPRG